MDRKQFLNKCCRLLLLGGIGTFSGYLVVNKRIVRESVCTISSVCNNCNKFVKCDLTQANNQREDGKKG